MKIENRKGWTNKEKQLKTSKNDEHAGKPIQKTRKTQENSRNRNPKKNPQTQKKKIPKQFSTQ